MTNSRSKISKFGQNLFHRLPSIRRRDELIADLKSELAKFQKSNEHNFYGSSFIRKHNEEIRVSFELSKMSAHENSEYVGLKLTKSGIREFANQLNLKVPKVFGTWESISEIPWDELPKAFVLKSEHGSTSKGVLPVFENNGLWQVASSEKRGSMKALLEPFDANLESGKIDGPFHIEELLYSPRSGKIAPEIKIYTFYGQPALVWLRKVDDFYGGAATKRAAFFDALGNRVHNIRSVYEIDNELKPPRNFEYALEVAKKASLATRLPQVRIDLYEHKNQIYLGEVTPYCGVAREFSYGSPWDEYLGKLWEHAQVRIEMDLARGRINQSGPVVRTGETPIPVDLLTPPTFNRGHQNRWPREH